MSLGDDLRKEVRGIFNTSWSVRDGRKVPEPEDIALGNDAVRLDATVLYSDMDGSTALVDQYTDWFAADVYKAYLHCTAKVIRSEGGVITSYDGDRIMAVFIGDSKNTVAARCALKINYAVKHIINEAIKNRNFDKPYTVKHVTGIDTSKLFIARTGIRGSNDLVWVGRSANYAAKLTELSSAYGTWITGDVYADLDRSSTYGKDDRNMWERMQWKQMNNMTVYRSDWWWEV